MPGPTAPLAWFINADENLVITITSKEGVYDVQTSIRKEVR